MTKAFLEIDWDVTYGKPFMKDGVEYVHGLPWWKRPLYRFTNVVQWIFWKLGYSWHNSLANECTPDFSCCRGKQ